MNDSKCDNIEDSSKGKNKMSVSRIVISLILCVIACLLLYPIGEIIFKLRHLDSMKSDNKVLKKIINHGISVDDYKKSMKITAAIMLRKQISYLSLSLPTILIILYLVNTKTLKPALYRMKTANKYIFYGLLTKERFGTITNECRLTVVILVFLMHTLAPHLISIFFYGNISLLQNLLFLAIPLFYFLQIKFCILKYVISRWGFVKMTIFIYIWAFLKKYWFLFIPITVLSKETFGDIVSEKGFDIPKGLLFGDKIDQYRHNLGVRTVCEDGGNIFEAFSIILKYFPFFPVVKLGTTQKKLFFGGFRPVIFHEYGHVIDGDIASIGTKNGMSRFLSGLLPFLIRLSIHLLIYINYMHFKFDKKYMMIPLFISAAIWETNSFFR